MKLDEYLIGESYTPIHLLSLKAQPLRDPEQPTIGDLAAAAAAAAILLLLLLDLKIRAAARDEAYFCLNASGIDEPPVPASSAPVVQAGNVTAAMRIRGLYQFAVVSHIKYNKTE